MLIQLIIQMFLESEFMWKIIPKIRTLWYRFGHCANRLLLAKAAFCVQDLCTFGKSCDYYS